MLIHAGDATAHGSLESLAKVGREMCGLPYRFKIFVPGNHERIFAQRPGLAVQVLANSGVITLIDELIVLPGGLSIYGTPWIQNDPHLLPAAVATFCTLDAREQYAKIPDYVDVLVTHQPPHGVLSLAHDGTELGSSQLANELQYRVHPRLHVFGHVHEQYGWTYMNDMPPLYVNAALCDPCNRPSTPPIQIYFGDTLEIEV